MCEGRNCSHLLDSDARVLCRFQGNVAHSTGQLAELRDLAGTPGYGESVMSLTDLSLCVQADASNSGKCTLAQSSRPDELVTRPTGLIGWKLKNKPLTRVDLHIRGVEERLRRQIAWSEHSPEQMCLVHYWWKRFSLFLIDRLIFVTRSKVLKARRGWFMLASRYHRRLHEATCYKATESVIHVCQQAGLRMCRNVAVWPHRRARNRCLVCVANYISSDDPADRKNLLSRAHHTWQDVPSQQ